MNTTTIPIRKVPGKLKPWLLDMRSAGGGREFYASEDEAKEIRKQKLTELRNFGTVAFSLSPAERMEFVAVRDRLAAVGATIQRAAEFFLNSRQPKASKTIAEALELMLAEKGKAKRRPRYVRQIGYDVRGFAATIGSDTACNAVAVEQISTWLHGNGWSDKTMHGKIISLQTFFSYAIKRGWADANPCRGVEPIKVDYKKPGILTPDQAEQLMRAAESHPTERRLIPYLALALFAGVRPQEVRRLSWAVIKNGEIWLESAVSKVRHHRVVSLSENCRAWLALGGELPPVNWEDGVQRVRQAAGFEFSERSKRRGQKSVSHPGIPWPHNAMRHSFISYSLPVHGVAETARQAGTSEDKVHSNYKALTTKAEAERFWAIKPRVNK